MRRRGPGWRGVQLTGVGARCFADRGRCLAPLRAVVRLVWLCRSSRGEAIARRHLLYRACRARDARRESAAQRALTAARGSNEGADACEGGAGSSEGPAAFLVVVLAPCDNLADARDEGRVRAVLRGLACRRRQRSDLQLRVHVLRPLRRGARQVPQLRRRTREASTQEQRRIVTERPGGVDAGRSQSNVESCPPDSSTPSL